MDRGNAMSSLKMRDHSITLYWVIMCCDWVGSGVFDCPDSEATLGAMTYSLRKPGGRSLLGTFGGFSSGWFCDLYCCGKSSTLLLREV